MMLIIAITSNDKKKMNDNYYWSDNHKIDNKYT